MRCAVVLMAIGLLARVVFAGPVESAIVAAMKLPEAPNYSWRTEVADDVRTYEIIGATDRATDLSLVTMPMAMPGWNRGPRGSAGNSTLVTALFRGDEKCVIQYEESWRRLDEIPAPREMSRGGRGGFGGSPRMGGMPGMGGPRGRGSRSSSGGGLPSDGQAESGRGYSNLQNTLSRPHEEIAVIIAGASDMRAEGEVVTGTLSETAAKLLLVHAGQKDITPLQASGTVRLWVKNGALAKYETRLEGVLAVEGSSGRRKVTVQQTATTVLSEVGTTKFEVPAEAEKKLK